MADDERDDDGLPLDPEARRAAIDAQFDEARAVLKPLDEREVHRTLGCTADDSLRVLLSRELVRAGVQVDSLRSLFDSLEIASAPMTKPWAWLRSEEARDQGAALVLLRPRQAGVFGIGAVCLTTAAQAVAWLQSKRTTIVVDVNICIAELEHVTGRSYVTPARPQE